VAEAAPAELFRRDYGHVTNKSLMAERVSLAAEFTPFFLDLANTEPVYRTTYVLDPRTSKLDSPSIQM
jgi:hypothetical protein